jgi:hypothetical protein
MKTPLKNEWARKRIEKNLRYRAKFLQAEGAKLDRLAKKLEADRLAGLDPLRADLGAVSRLLGRVPDGLKQFLGFDCYEAVSRDQISDRLFPPLRCAEPEPRVNAVAKLPGDTRLGEARLITRDAVEEAAAIVRQVAAGEIEIDWTKEPASERERKIRAVILGDCTQGGIGSLSRSPAFMSIMLRNLISIFDEPASDLRAEMDRVDALCREEERLKKRQQVQDAIRRVEGL